MGKGHKVCSVCGAVVGPRAFNCPQGHGFVVKGVKQPDLIPATNGNTSVSAMAKANARGTLSHKEVNWQELVKGDTIKVSGGPIWETTKENEDNTNMGYNGIYTVHSLSADGIHAYPLKAKHEGGHCFIYMNKERKMPSGTTMKPHVIKKVHRKVKV